MPHTNPPWRFDPLQMPVNINWGIPGACVIISDYNQVFYASDPTQWQEFDLPGWYDAAAAATQFGYPAWRFGASSVVSDLLHKKFWITAEHVVSRADSTTDIYQSPSPDFAGGWVIDITTSIEYSSPDAEYWVNTGFFNSFGGPFGAVDDSGPWTTDGGHTWNTSVPPDATQEGLKYPVSNWNDLYLSMDGRFNPILSDANGNHAIPVKFPSGWGLDQGKIAAGNGVIVAVISNSANTAWRVGVTKDNQSWTMLGSIGDIPSITPNPGPNTIPGRPGSPYFNFNDALLTFVPNFGPPDPHSTGGNGYFVFTGCTAQPYSFSQFVQLEAGTGPASTPVSVSGTFVAPDPLQIYTSPDGVNWTKQFQAGYTNGSAPPMTFNGQEMSYTDQYYVQLDPPGVVFLTVPFDHSQDGYWGPNDGGFIPHGVSLAPGFISYDYNGTGFTDATRTTASFADWWSLASEGAALNGYSLSGSLPGTVRATFPSPPGYFWLDDFSHSFVVGYNGNPQTFTYSSVFNGRGWGFDPGVRQIGGVLTSQMEPQSIAGSGYSFPIIKAGA